MFSEFPCFIIRPNVCRNEISANLPVYNIIQDKAKQNLVANSARVKKSRRKKPWIENNEGKNSLNRNREERKKNEIFRKRNYAVSHWWGLVIGRIITIGGETSHHCGHGLWLASDTIDEYNKKNLVLSNELIKVKLPPRKIWKADLSSVRPSSDRIEEFWVVVGFMGVWKNFAVAENIVTWICE